MNRSNESAWRNQSNIVHPSDSIRKDLSSIPMRPWEKIEPDAKRWAAEHYAPMPANTLRILCGRGHGSKTAMQMRNMLVKRHVAFEKEQWSRDISAGRGVNENAV